MSVVPGMRHLLHVVGVVGLLLYPTRNVCESQGSEVLTLSSVFSEGFAWIVDRGTQAMSVVF